MIVTVSAIGALAATALFSSGYLFGARRGVDARRSLDAECTRRDAVVRDLEARQKELVSAASESAAARAQLQTIAQTLARQGQENVVDDLRVELANLGALMRKKEVEDGALRNELRNELATVAKSGNDPVRLERELRRIVGPMLERQNDTKNLQDLVKKTLEPMMDRERLRRELAQIEVGASLGELPRLLDGIAETAGFSTVVLSDDVGLPLAANKDAKSVDWLAGLASLVLTMVERAERSGQPKPIGIVVQDESNQMTLHRVFRVGESYFLLTAVSRGLELAPSALDAALGKLERVLARPDAATV